ncbi:hypothetical protein GOBAR_AA21306 [Gossypium barbadense]|uniref:RNase H type-1 domain-containing protein n=1 Tax=Gossypium barbadense TaxID=3634 RepID=A0A2P5X7P5_GOSBA|nr:hypothetical protein GOBAR_AA21306 [Gossypium barbadense]
MAKRLSRRVTVESDNLSAITVLNGAGVSTSSCPIIRSSGEPRRRPWKVQVCHIFLEVNRAADFFIYKAARRTFQYGDSMAKRLSRRVTVESDNLSAITVLNGAGVSTSSCPIIRSSGEPRRRPWKVQVCHIFLEVNRAADFFIYKAARRTFQYGDSR